MPAPKLLPDIGTLTALRNQGWTYADIARHYGVTVGAVYLNFREANQVKPRPDYKAFLPWRVKTEHAHTHPATMLRLLGRQSAGDELPAPKERMLRKWLRDMAENELVVCYHPDCPPNPASPRTGGFYYQPRQPSDGDSLIRFEDGGSETDGESPADED